MQNRAMGSTGFGGGFDFSGGGDLKSMLLQAMFGTPATGTASSSANAGAASSLFGSLSISSSWSSGLSSLSRAWNGFTSGAAQMFQSSFSLQGRLTSQGSQTVASLSASLSVSVSAAASATASGASGSGQVTIETILSVVRGEGFWDPVVLDLGGDGFNFRNAEDGADFDFDGDGTTERAGFIQGDDALLFLATDANGGRAQNGLDLFGDAAGHIHGFAALAEHDGNADGVIDENDAVYDQLRLWQDRNGDGVCDDDEVMTMAEAGVASLRLDYANTMERDEHGNLITQRSAFTRADGSAGAMVDAQFRAACAAAAYGMATP